MGQDSAVTLWGQAQVLLAPGNPDHGHWDQTHGQSHSLNPTLQMTCLS